jgi:hypothetical protein
MRPYWLAPFLFISLGILLLVCFAVDGDVINLAKFSTVAHIFPLSYCVRCMGVGLIGTAGTKIAFN